MTEAQEAILDQLMVAETIGAPWESGPLGVALRALAAGELRTCRDAARALGYPALLCQALHSANAILETAEDRRKLAVTFFSEVAPRPRAPRLTRRRYAEVALWGALRVHPLVCRPRCPYARRLSRAIRDSLADPESHPLLQQPDPERKCPADITRGWGFVCWDKQPPEYCASAALRYAFYASWSIAHYDRWPGSDSRRAAGYAARAAALVEGVTGAVDFCLAQAREVGL
jgi:hypothetical protein